jgi:nicotinate-nucleotide adenylyltransferase
VGQRGLGLNGDARTAIGVLGGTFDPVHLGHLAIAEQTRETLDLDAIVFMPAGSPPHKRDQSVTSADHRATMVALAIADNPRFRLSRIELDRPGPSYAVDTLRQLAAEAAAAGRTEPVFILSAEALVQLPGWRDPAGILDAARIAVVPRLGIPDPTHAWLEQHFPGREDRFTFLPGPRLGHSSTDIRERAARGGSIRYLVPPTVEAYIGEHRLYLAPTATLQPARRIAP